MIVKKTPEFMEWFYKESNKTRLQVISRLERISSYSHFGDMKNLGGQLFELRWRNGRRIYFTFDENNCLVLLGGNKNGQTKDIKEARRLQKRETSSDALGSD